MGVAAFCVTCLTIDCNNFFMKFVLYVPAEHDMLKCRVALWGLASIAIAKEWYEFISNDYCHRLGAFAWLAFYTAGVEVLVVVRSSAGLFTEPFPWYVKVIWTFLAFFFAALFYIAWRNEQRNEALKNKSDKEFNPYNPDLHFDYHSNQAVSNQRKKQN